MMTISPAAAGVIFALMAALAIVTGWLVWRRPDRLLRELLWLLAHTLYRLRVLGREHIPARGPVLFVCNHLSYFDAFLLFTTVRRPVRFLVWAPMTRARGLKVLLRWLRVIPMESEAGPRQIVRALRAAADALNQGETVCIFAEEAVTRAGFRLPFHLGLRKILKRARVPVVPVRMDHVWGCIFSFHGGRFLWKWPQRIPYPVSVAFGAPLPPTVRAVEVRQALQKLSADCSVARGDECLPVHRQFVHMAARHPFRTCFIDHVNNGKVYRYGEALAGAVIFAKLLRPILGDERMVGLWLPSSVGGAFANIAVTFLGKQPINLNYTAGTDNVQSAIRQCGIRKVLTSRLFTSKMPLEPGPGVELVYLEEFRKQVTTWQRLRTFALVVLLPTFLLERWLGLHRHGIDDLASVIFSSGSTGEPKGVMLSQRNIAANAESMIQAIDPGPRDRVLGILPFFHSFGFTVTLWVPLMVGASVVYFPDPRQAKEIGDLCRQYRCTIFLTTPTFLRFCLRRCEPGDFTTLRILICGAEKLPAGLAEEFQQKFSVLPLEGYGCTELSPVAAANIPDWEENGVHQIGNKSGTIGQPVPGIAARIVDPDTFAERPAGEAGLLMIYGGNVMQGYLGREEATRGAIRDGWYVTGDIGRIDEDGFITLTDRLSRFSKIGGEMVPHGRIEEELQVILGTTERACVVTAVPDERRGERLVVLHTPLNGADIHGIWQQLNERGLPNLWIPAERDFYQIPELPVLGSGKIDLKRIKDLAVSRSVSA